MHDQRVRARPPLDREDARDRVVARRVGAEPVHGLGRERDQPAAADHVRGARDIGAAARRHGTSGSPAVASPSCRPRGCRRARSRTARRASPPACCARPSRTRTRSACRARATASGSARSVRAGPAARPADVPGVPLVAVAHVDQVDGLVLTQLGELVRLDRATMRSVITEAVIVGKGSVQRGRRLEPVQRRDQRVDVLAACCRARATRAPWLSSPKRRRIGCAQWWPERTAMPSWSSSAADLLGPLPVEHEGQHARLLRRGADHRAGPGTRREPLGRVHEQLVLVALDVARARRATASRARRRARRRRRCCRCRPRTAHGGGW